MLFWRQAIRELRELSGALAGILQTRCPEESGRFPWMHQHAVETGKGKVSAVVLRLYYAWLSLMLNIFGLLLLQGLLRAAMGEEKTVSHVQS